MFTEMFRNYTIMFSINLAEKIKQKKKKKNINIKDLGPNKVF